MKFNSQDIFVLLENSRYQPSPSYDYISSNEVEEKLETINFINTQVISLQKLFIQLSPADKKECTDYLLSMLTFHSNVLIAATAFSALIHIGKFEEAFSGITKNFINYDHVFFYVFLLSELSEILKSEWRIFNKEQINLIYIWTHKVNNGENVLGRNIRIFDRYHEQTKKIVDSLHKKTNIIKTLDLKEQIFVGTSQEITSDEKALKLEFKRYNFPDDLSETLDKIDLDLASASDNFDYQKSMGLIRSFTERLFSHICITLDPREGQSVDEKSSEKVADYLVKKKFISSEQGELLIAFRHFLSNQGVHRLKSRPDDARLSRNMMIELSLYLLLRLKDY